MVRAHVHSSGTGAAQERRGERGVSSLVEWPGLYVPVKRDILSRDIYSLNCVYPASPIHPGKSATVRAVPIFTRNIHE